MHTWKIRIAPSLGGGFAGTPQEVWGVRDYTEYDDSQSPTVFMGLYGLPDFYSLWRHKGHKAVFWCGSDIQHFLRGYYLENEGKMKLNAFDLAPWIDTFCENYVENEVEQQALRTVGIRSKVVPSFLGDVKKFEVCYTWSDKPKVYTSVSGDDFRLYGWDKIPELANKNPEVKFHLYGNKAIPWEFDEGHPHPTNIFFHGRVPQEQMDAETKEMQGALRLTEFDGFSEIIAKSFLWGQYPVSLIPYAFSLHPNNLQELAHKKKPNIQGREWLLSNVNKFPWNQK